jgi:hypothetical protein
MTGQEQAHAMLGCYVRLSACLPELSRNPAILPIESEQWGLRFPRWSGLAALGIEAKRCQCVAAPADCPRVDEAPHRAFAAGSDLLRISGDI